MTGTERKQAKANAETVVAAYGEAISMFEALGIPRNNPNYEKAIRGRNEGATRIVEMFNAYENRIQEERTRITNDLPLLISDLVKIDNSDEINVKITNDGREIEINLINDNAVSNLTFNVSYDHFYVIPNNVFSIESYSELYKHESELIQLIKGNHPKYPPKAT